MHHPDTRAEMENPLEDAPARGFGPLPCPRCGERTTVAVDLDDLEVFACRGCDAEFAPADVEAIITAWTPVLAWLRQAPVKE
jgi:hypothetical protein